MTVSFRQEFVSVSRLNLLAQCGLAFKLRYIDRVPGEPRGEPAEFGTLIHAALERVHAWALEAEHRGRVTEAMILDAWQREFSHAPPSVTSPALYAEGLELVRGYFRRNPELDAHQLIANEQEFRVAVGRFVVLGYMDRVERIDDETVLIDDYKSGRRLYSSEEIDTDVQASVYQLAARELYPWAKRVVFRFQMLRFGLAIEAPRDESQLAIARDYVIALAERSESGREDVFSPRLNANCAYCDFRRRCPAYASALATSPDFAEVDRDDFESIAREYLLMNTLARAAYARRDELATLLRARIQELGPVEAASHRFQVVPVSAREFMPSRVMDLLGGATGLSDRQLADEVMSVDKKSIDRLLRSLDGPQNGRQRSSPRVRMLRARIEASAEDRTKTARIDARPIRQELKASNPRVSLPVVREGSR